MRPSTTTSHPSHGPPTSRTASRITRLHRFLATALPSRLPATNATRPARPRPSGVSFASSVSSRLASRRPSRKIVSISRADLIVVMPTTHPAEALRLCAEYFATLATTRCKHGSAAASRHASSEAVRLRTLPDIGLVCTLHNSPPWCSSRIGAKPDEYMRAQEAVSIGPPCVSCSLEA
jgi:hypothetical protein